MTYLLLGVGSALALGCSDRSAVVERSGQPSPHAPAAAGSGPSAANGGAQDGVDNPAPSNNLGTVAPVIPVRANCAPGHYIGSFSGNYRSAAWLNGSEPLDFATSDANGLPGFEFWLQAVQQPCPAGTEFCPGAVVKGGKLRGSAAPFTDASSGNDMTNPFQLSVRFEIDLTGELDCSTGKFRGQLQNGCYDVLSTLYRFAGTLTSGYDPTKNAFTDGTWSVIEVPMDSIAPADPAIGGSGIWDAKLAGAGEAPADMGKGLCAGMTGFDTPAP